MVNPAGRTVLSVGELAETLRSLVETALPSIWVQGEVSNFRNPSGHWYFTLKDAQAQVRVAMFKGANFYVKPLPKDGDQVLIRGSLSYYAARGDLQIVAEHLEPAGSGALLQAFEALKKKLASEGLFDEHLKRPLPALPKCIGLITSPTGAALQDMLTTLRRRYSIGSLLLASVPVQGEAAAAAIVKALQQITQHPEVDVVVLARGGGSIEDLWCFNDERIVRAIRACPVPVVTGIGHEIDFTLADFAADLRAPTPTAAAEMVSPDTIEMLESLEQISARLYQQLRQGLDALKATWAVLSHRINLSDPRRRLQQQMQRLDDLQQRLLTLSPATQIRLEQRLLDQHRQTLRTRLREHLQNARVRHEQWSSLLNSFSPRAVLERGYAIVQTTDGHVVSKASSAKPGDHLNITLAEGELATKVISPQ